MRMVALLLLTLYLLSIVSYSKQFALVTANVTVSWSGGGPKCGSCEWGTYVEDFACSDYDWEWNSGSWENGTKSFHDPLMEEIHQEYYISQVIATVRGVFDCRDTWSWEPTRFRVFLASQLLTHWDWEDSRICMCANCIEELVFVSRETEGWPGYIYGGINNLSIVVDENVVCLSSIELSFTYSRAFNSLDLIRLNHSRSNDAWLRGVTVFGVATVAVVVIVCIVTVGTVVLRKHWKRGGYDEIPSDSLLMEGRNTSNLAAKYSGMFQIRGNEITLGPRIGKGSYGEVFRAEWRGILVAVKKLPVAVLENKELLQDFNREATIMSSLRHPNVLQFLGCCMIEADICIVTEYMNRGSLHRILHDERFEVSWDLIRRFALETAQGMLYLHQSSPPILHRDLKSHNLLVDDAFRVKISDFGLSKVMDRVNNTMTSCGTAAWAAPEVLKNARYTGKADVYSFGICLWEFWSRKDPYEGMPTMQIIFAVGTEGMRPAIGSTCPAEYSDLIQQCWDVDALKRPDFDEIVRRLKQLRFESTE